MRPDMNETKQTEPKPNRVQLQCDPSRVRNRNYRRSGRAAMGAEERAYSVGGYSQHGEEVGTPPRAVGAAMEAPAIGSAGLRGAIVSSIERRGGLSSIRVSVYRRN